MTPCDHCGLPVPAGLVDEGAELQFCCSGCRVAYEVIHGAGLEGYYALKNRIDAPEQAALGRGGSFDRFDDETFTELYCTRREDGLHSVELYLEGVHCAACVWLVESTPMAIPGVVECRLDVGRSLAVVTWDPDRVALSDIARFLDSIGYPPHPFHGVEARDMERREDRALLIRIAVAGAVAGNVMLLAFALYGGHFHGITDEYRRLFRWVSLGLTMVSVVWCAQVFYRGAWGALRTRTLHMDVPITVGILAAFGWGTANTVRDLGEVYFDSVTVLIFFLLVGRWVQRRQQRRAARATELLFTLAPSTARVITDKGVRETPAAALQPGMVIELRAGDSAPADGVVRHGRSTMDLSLLTGESRPEAVGPGDPIHAGTTSLSGRLEIEVRTAGADTRLGRLLRLVEEGAQRRAPVVLLADRISGWFVVVVLGLAALTAAIWFAIDPAQAVENAVALLIVSCPCALGLATPLAVSAAVGQAARKKILIKGGDALEAMAKPATMILDKTGTLTKGRLAVVRWVGGEQTRRDLAAIQTRSTHPVAVALAAGIDLEGTAQPTEVEQHPGRGITGRVEGREILAGSPAFAAERLGAMAQAVAHEINSAVQDGLTPVVVGVDGEVAAVAALGDPVRTDSAESIAAIEDRGWRVEVLSGDYPGTVAALIRTLGLDPAAGRGGALPEDKVERVHRLAATGNVAMVGDGVNDAAALAAATVGIAVHGGAEAAMAAADVYFGEPGLDPLVRLLDGSVRTMAVIRRNLVFSLAYNAVAVTLAMLGLMHPLVAAILMPASSITVVVSSYKARTFLS
ncbi:MAG: heavy metal translocating P-type ATPase [Thermoanaerobaculales bacterium]|jgi:Cu2+-exporting ATPase|nr:heavy metal translocating P-type ATPase [Thermoanaerobaculales bacterium]